MEKGVSVYLGLRPIEATGGKRKNFTGWFLFAVQLLVSKMMGQLFVLRTSIVDASAVSKAPYSRGTCKHGTRPIKNPKPVDFNVCILYL